MRESLDIVVPVFNVESCIDDFYRRIAAAGYANSLVFVDDASTDGTVDRIHRYTTRIIRHAANLGYGASIRDGIAVTRGDFIVVIDAGLEYSPEVITELVGALQHHAVVHASRFLDGTPIGMPLARRTGNQLVSHTFNVLFGQQTTDLYTGLKGFRRETLQQLVLKQNGFEHGLELSARLANRGYRIHEIPVTYTSRVKSVSKTRHIPEAVKCVCLVLWYRFQFLITRPFLRRLASSASTSA